MLHIEFTSAKFLPYLPEAYQANPGVYGFELALWLSQALMRANIPTSYPIGEDWGWLIEYIDGDAEFMLGCGSQAEAGEAYTGQPIDWYIFIKQHRSLKQRLLGSAAPALAAMLRDAILTALQAEGITPKSQSPARDANNQVNETDTDNVLQGFSGHQVLIRVRCRLLERNLVEEQLRFGEELQVQGADQELTKRPQRSTNLRQSLRLVASLGTGLIDLDELLASSRSCSPCLQLLDAIAPGTGGGSLGQQ